MDKDERIKMSFGFASDIVKQLIALSTAIVTLCVALADRLFSSWTIEHNSIFLLIALVFFVLSILCGLLCMMAITGTLGKPEESTTETKVTTDKNSGTIYQSNIVFLMKAHIFIFLGGIIMSVVFICAASFSHSIEETMQNEALTKISNPISVERVTNYNILDNIKVDTIVLDADMLDNIQFTK